MVTAAADFTAPERERSRAYNLPRRVAALLDVVVSLAAVAVLAFGWPGHRLSSALDGVPWAAAAVLTTVATIVGPMLILLPLSFWRGHLHERRFGLSTQGARAWLGDWLKGLAVGTALAAPALLGLVGLARALPGGWPAVAAPASATIVVLLGFVAPVLLEPIFNRFEPLADEGLASELRRLAERAGVPISDVLVADASRRTRKVNAYVSGLGRTRRVVLYDTLLTGTATAEVRLVTAHELAHRRARHVVKGTVIAAASAAGLVLVLWGLLSWGPLLRALDAGGAGDARAIPLIVLAAGGLELLAAPLAAALSRRFERQADRASLELTDDLDAFVAVHRRLAVTNVSDLAPPRWLYLWFASHPTAPERIAAARAWAAGLRRA